MAELEDKFQEILGNPSAMNQIMALAQSISSSEKQEPEWSPVEQPSTPDLGLEGMLNGLDPAMLSAGMKLLNAYQSHDNRTAGLMLALRPFVNDSRHKTLDRLSQATKIAKVLSGLLEIMGEKGEKNATV